MTVPRDAAHCRACDRIGSARKEGLAADRAAPGDNPLLQLPVFRLYLEDSFGLDLDLGQ